MALVLRDMEFTCFAEPDEALPTFLEESCMEKEDALVIAAGVDNLSEAIFNHIK